MRSLATFSITATESMRFARASGDYNPLHLDPVAARRTRFGQTLIHGVHGTIKALDLLMQTRGSRAALSDIRIKYSKPVRQDQELELVSAIDDGNIRLELFAQGVRCQIIDLHLREAQDAPRQADLPGAPDTGEQDCAVLGIADCHELSGAVELSWDEGLMMGLFPSAVKLLPAAQLASLLATTRIVGMRCPGLHSVFAQLDLVFGRARVDSKSGQESQMVYRVGNADPRLDRVELHVQSTYAKGTVEAFFRPPPVQQAAFEHITNLVASTEFQQQNALVIGASRGLGEVITKVLAAGGARIMMSFAAGRDDANRVAGEIGGYRTAPQTCFYDVLEGAPGEELQNFLASVTHIYYLASPSIAKSDRNTWDQGLFHRYCDFYIGGLATLLQHALSNRPASEVLQVFIPSTVFLEQKARGFDEYVAAKAAAETFARSFEDAHRMCSLVMPRLPRLLTDQTSSVRDIDSQTTLEVMIKQLRESFGSNNNRRS